MTNLLEKLKRKDLNGQEVTVAPESGLIVKKEDIRNQIIMTQSEMWALQTRLNTLASQYQMLEEIEKVQSGSVSTAIEEVK